MAQDPVRESQKRVALVRVDEALGSLRTLHDEMRDWFVADQRWSTLQAITDAGRALHALRVLVERG